MGAATTQLAFAGSAAAPAAVLAVVKFDPIRPRAAGHRGIALFPSGQRPALKASASARRPLFRLTHRSSPSARPGASTPIASPMP